MIERFYDDRAITPRVIRAEGEAVVYDQVCPQEMLDEGILLGLSDFQQAAEIAGTSRAVGTRVLKETIVRLGEREEPFTFIRWLDGNIKSHGICTNYGYVGVKLPDFYVRTQQLYDHVQAITHSEAVRLYGAKGSLVVRALLFDEGAE